MIVNFITVYKNKRGTWKWLLTIGKAYFYNRDTKSILLSFLPLEENEICEKYRRHIVPLPPI